MALQILYYAKNTAKHAEVEGIGKKTKKRVKKHLTTGAGSGILSELSPRGALGNKALEKSFEKSEKRG